MKKTLLAVSAAALLAGSTATWAQGSAAGNNPSGPNTTHSTQHPMARPDEGSSGPGAVRSGRGDQPGMQENEMRRDSDRNGAGAYEHTQLQGDRNQMQGDRNRLQGGEMLRGGDVRGRGGPTLTVREKTNLRETVLRRGPRVTHVNFRIGVGARVPRDIRLVAVPQPIVALYPEWSGDLFFDYGDEIVVVAPGSMEIVGVLPV
jgi:hypothetical protein